MLTPEEQILAKQVALSELLNILVLTSEAGPRAIIRSRIQIILNGQSVGGQDVWLLSDRNIVELLKENGFGPPERPAA